MTWQCPECKRTIHVAAFCPVCQHFNPPGSEDQLEPRRLLEVFRHVVTGIQVGVRTPEEWVAWQKRLGFHAAEKHIVLNMTLLEIEKQLAPLRAGD